MAVFTPEEMKEFKAQMDGTPFVAQRRLSETDSLKYDYYTPKNWHLKQPLIPPRETPPSSGLGYTQSPYISMWTKMWGVNPISDLAKYRLMYRTVPIIKKGVDKTVSTAVSKGFKLDLPEDVPNRGEILALVQEWVSEQQDFKQTIQMLASDALIYGNAYMEIVYDEEDTTEEEKQDPSLVSYKIADPSEQYKFSDDYSPYLEEKTVNNPGGKYFEVSATGRPLWLKPLDPLWMRVRRDSYGNTFGYIQYLSTPPVAFTPGKIIHVKFNPKTWWTENAYGTSNLMSLVRTQEAIWQLENDLIVISHACAKPPLIFSCGTEDSPWSEGDFSGFVTATNGRGPGGDVYHRGDVEAHPLPFPASSLAPLLAHLDYHHEQRIIALGVPPDLLGISGYSKSVATVGFDDWINTIQQLQQYLADAIQEQVFKVLVENEFGEGTPIPKIIWNSIYEKDSQAEVTQMIALKNSQIITTNEARKWLEEIGKKLFPLEGGDVLGQPSVLPPEEGGVQDMLSDSAKVDKESDVVGEEVASGAFEAEYTKPPVVDLFLYDPEDSDIVEEKKAWWEQDESFIYPRPELIADKGDERPVEEAEKLTSEEEATRFKELLPEKKILRSSEERQQGHQPGSPVETIKNYIKDEPGQGEHLENRTEWPNVKPWKASEKEDVKIRSLLSHEGVDFYLVDGDKVSEQYDPEWKNKHSPTEHDYIGGHHWVFDYIPENEIWISDLDPNAKYTMVHEFAERALMKNGMPYAEAHHKALIAQGDLPGAEIAEMEYISPEQVVKLLNDKLERYHHTEVEHAWLIGDKIIIFDDVKGELIVTEKDGKEIKRSLVRSAEDVENLVEKYKVEKEVKEIKATVEDVVKYIASSKEEETKRKKALEEKKMELMDKMITKWGQ